MVLMEEHGGALLRGREKNLLSFLPELAEPAAIIRSTGGD